MTTNYGSSFWKDYVLPYAPEETYFSSAPFGGQITAANPFGGREASDVNPFGRGFSPASQSYWAGQYGNVMNQYLGEGGRKMRAGEDPTTLSFMDYLEQYPWTERYTAMSPSLRPGGRTSRFSPSTRYVF